MIEQLNIKDYAIIEQLDLELYPGLTVITGETGSGKTILLDALAVSLGSRADRVMVRHGAERAVMETKIAGNTIRRLVSLKGHTKAYYNDEPVTLTALKEQTAESVDFHGQHDQQLILDVQHHIHYLDRFCGSGQRVKEIQDLFQELVAARTQLSHLRRSSSERRNRLDLLNFQAGEIDAASPKEHEDVELDKVYRKLCNLGEIQKKLQEIHVALVHGDHAVADVIHQSLRTVESLSKYDEELMNIGDLIQSALIQIQETGSEITLRLSSAEFDPLELVKIEERVQALETLKRKYGGSLEAVMQYRKSIQEELDDLAGSGCSEEELVQKIKDLEKKYSSLAITLNSIRTTHAVFLASKVEKAMKTLNMPDARFEIRITQTSDKQGFVALESQSVEAGANGVDQVEFYLSANPGELVKPLAAIASGGEVSRIMLAIKSVFQNLDPVQTLVFDEIDTGISGKAAESVADQLVNLSNSKQVLCITHLSQIAGRADHHLHITKSSNNGKTKVFAEYLTAQERPQVIRDLFIGSDMVNA